MAPLRHRERRRAGGRPSAAPHMAYVIDASERQVRAELRRWPDGEYHGESWMVSDGLDPTKRYRIAVAVTIAGSEITFDFSETDDQAPGFTNMPPAAAIGAVRIAFLMLLAAGGLTIPTNHGLFTPVHTVFRKGSLLDPHFPASTIFGNQMCDEVLEGTQEPSVSLTIFQRGGPGAMRGADGDDALGFTGTPGSMRSPDLEMFELSTPHLMHYSEYLPDSAGAGEWPNRWHRAATATTTPSPRASSRHSRRSSCTAAAGHPRPSCASRSLSTSRSSRS